MKFFQRKRQGLRENVLFLRYNCRSMGANLVVAVDVGSASETNLYNYGDSLSGFWVLLRKFNPFAEPVKVLNMEEIQVKVLIPPCVGTGN